MSGPRTLRARQRNDRDLAANEQKLEILAARRVALEAEAADLETERAALLAMAVSLRGEP